jgi:hypothetical protein
MINEDKKNSQVKHIHLNDVESKSNLGSILGDETNAVSKALKTQISGPSNTDYSTINNNIKNQTISNEPHDQNGSADFGISYPHDNNLKKSINSFFVSNEESEKLNTGRVFQKSIVLLLINLLFFSITSFFSINLFNLNPNPIVSACIGIVSIVFLTSTSNVFFIVLSDRVYFWISFFAQAILLLSVNTLIGYGFNSIVSLVTTLIISLMFYQAYLELEKNQLSSRLFNLSIITKESNRILITIGTLVLILGLFNQILFTGTDSNGTFNGADVFIDKVILSRQNIVDSYLIGVNDEQKKTVGLNNFAMNKNLYFVGDQQLYLLNGTPAQFRDYLIYNYRRPGDILLSEDEVDDVNSKCLKEKITNCDDEISKARDSKLDIWRAEAFSDLSLNLDSEMNLENYRAVTRQYYLNQIKNVSKNEETTLLSSLSVPIFTNISPKWFVPAIIAFGFYLFFVLIKPILQLLSYILTLIIWQILKLTGFVRIEVETVESEVVSI